MVKHKRTKKMPTAGAFVLGKQSFERISAVEGIRLSEGMRTRQLCLHQEAFSRGNS
jgi:hypothetical protein